MATTFTQVIGIALYAAVSVASLLQLLAGVQASPLPAGSAEGADYNATSWTNVTNQTLTEDSCQCNGTNLTMMIDGHFLFKWRASFSSHHVHSIRRLSEAAKGLSRRTSSDKTIDCNYTNNFNLNYHPSEPVTHALLKQFYNVFVLHRKYIEEKLLILECPWPPTPGCLNLAVVEELKTIRNELNRNIIRLYHVLNSSQCDCSPNDCEQTNIAFQQLNQSTQHCFEERNIPTSDVTWQIGQDADKLRDVIEKLLEGNPRRHTIENCSFSYHQIENKIKVETYKQTKNGVIVKNQWCSY